MDGKTTKMVPGNEGIADRSKNNIQFAEGQIGGCNIQKLCPISNPHSSPVSVVCPALNVRPADAILWRKLPISTP